LRNRCVLCRRLGVRPRLRPGVAMEAILGAIIGVGLLGYLTYALLFPEKF
jgi:K+-transporting ATPase KdpF subunit